MNTLLLVTPFLILFTVPTSFAEKDDFFSTLFGDAVIDNNDEYTNDNKDNGWFYGYGMVSVDDKGNVYVTDMTKHRVQKFSPTGEFLVKWGSTGTGEGQFVLPTSIAFDSAGNLFVADAGNNRIQKFTSTGEFLETLDGFGEIGVQQIIHTEIAIDSDDNVYAADSHRIHVFSSDGELISKLDTFGTITNGSTETNPMAIDVS